MAATARALAISVMPLPATLEGKAARQQTSTPTPRGTDALVGREGLCPHARNRASERQALAGFHIDYVAGKLEHATCRFGHRLMGRRMGTQMDATGGEANLARALLQEARTMALAGNIEDSLRISRKVVDRYWSKPGENSGVIAIDAFEAYLMAARSLVRTHDHLDAFAWQSNLLIEKLLERDDIQRAIRLLEHRAWQAVRIMRNGIHGYRDATRVIDIITENRVKLESQLENNDIENRIHEALELRFAAPSVHSVLLGAVEDLVGFEVSHPAFLTDTNFVETCSALAESGLVGPALSLRLIAKDHFRKGEEHELASIVKEWMPEDYFDQIEEYWAFGEGHLFGWRIPRMSAGQYIEHLTEMVANSRGEERDFGERMLVSAARNAKRIEEVRLAADDSA
jgi:hypothetical protein